MADSGEGDAAEVNDNLPAGLQELVSHYPKILKAVKTLGTTFSLARG
jgi:hypothetical protein